MKKILITGLDGSGKSTLIDKLKNLEADFPVRIINLPQMRTDNIAPDSLPGRTVLFVNQINKLADIQNNRLLKSIALFASMLLFKPLVQMAYSQNIQTLICERHPLIDATVYARFYAGSSYKSQAKLPDFSHLDKQFADEFNFLQAIAPKNFTKEFSLNTAGGILRLIFTRFGQQLCDTENRISEIFQLDYPDEIYYLQANAVVLYDRIKHRKTAEVHEKPQVLELLGNAYDLRLQQIEKENKSRVTRIDATEFENINQFTQNLYKALQYG